MIDDAEICSARKTIRPRRLIAGLGALLGVVVVTSGVFECILLGSPDGGSLATIPACLAMCRDWKSFRGHIDRLVVASRDRSADAAGQRSHGWRSAGSSE